MLAPVGLYYEYCAVVLDIVPSVDAVYRIRFSLNMYWLALAVTAIAAPAHTAIAAERIPLITLTDFFIMIISFYLYKFLFG